MEFDGREVAFINEKLECRVATVSEKNWPQVSTVVHVYDKGKIYFATDKGTRKIKNLMQNNKIGIVFDVYERQPRSLNVQGTTELLEKGAEFRKVAKLLEEKHEYYKANPIKEGDGTVIVKVTMLRKTGFGAN